MWSFDILCHKSCERGGNGGSPETTAQNGQTCLLLHRVQPKFRSKVRMCPVYTSEKQNIWSLDNVFHFRFKQQFRSWKHVERIYFFFSLMNKEKQVGLSPLPWDTLLPRTASPTDAQTIGRFPLKCNTSRLLCARKHK